MFSKMSKHVTYANVAMTVALVFVMTGGAYAAGKYLISSTKQISPKVLKQLKGKNGKNGAPGATGPQGPQGLAGTAGKDGTNGKDGVSVTGPEGPEGKEGKAGTTGFTKTLPKGETLKGEWGMVTAAPEVNATVGDSVSFGIPLAAAPTAHYIKTTGKEPFYNATTKLNDEREQPACPGSATEPEADPGNLCVYASIESNTQLNLPPGTFAPLPVICPFSTGGVCFVKEPRTGTADPYGFVIMTLAEEARAVDVGGTWAVTAP